MDSLDSGGQVVLTGGGAKNLGGLTSRQFAEMGAKVAVRYNSAATKAAAEETVAAVKKIGTDAFAIQADLTKPGEVTLIFDETIKRFGGTEVAVNRSTPRAW